MELIWQPGQMMGSDAMRSWKQAQWSQMEGPLTYTGLWREKVIAIAGLVKMWFGRWSGWAVLGVNVGPVQLRAIHRDITMMLKVLQTRPTFRRIEIACRMDFPQAHRWAHLMGFTREAELRSYNPDGTDAVLYARIA